MSSGRFPVPLAVTARRLRVSLRTISPEWRAKRGIVDVAPPKGERVDSVWNCPDTVDSAVEHKKEVDAAKKGKPFLFPN